MDLILWRHAEAEDGDDDLARVLTAKGHRQAETMARWLNDRLPEGCTIMSSPAARAQQTARSLGRPVVAEPALSPGAAWQAILDAADWPGRRTGCVLVVGHQPTLGEVAAQLLGTEGSLSIRKAGVWWFSSRSREEGNEAVLKAVMVPDLL